LWYDIIEALVNNAHFGTDNVDIIHQIPILCNASLSGPVIGDGVGLFVDAMDYL